MAGKRKAPEPGSLANLDRDNNGDPGGSLPKRYPVVGFSTGGVHVVTGAEARDELIDAGLARLATADDLDIAGRRDLLHLLQPAFRSPQ